MNSKKKWIIAICSLGVVALSAVIALVAVIAAFNATGDSAFTITYSAKNVNAAITAEYARVADTTDVSTIQYTKLEVTGTTDTTMTFSASDDTEEVTKSFKATATGIGKTEYIYIHYTIANTDTTGETTFKLTCDTAITTNKNLEIKYASTNTADTVWGDSIADLGIDSVTYSEDGSTTQHVWVRIAIANKTEGAQFDGAFKFNLVVNE